MKKINRRSFLGKLFVLITIPFFPIQALRKKELVLPTKFDPELTKLSLSYMSPMLSGMSPVSPNIPLGIARRDIKDGEFFEYNPSMATKDIIPVSLLSKKDLKKHGIK